MKLSSTSMLMLSSPSPPLTTRAARRRRSSRHSTRAAGRRARGPWGRRCRAWRRSVTVGVGCFGKGPLRMVPPPRITGLGHLAERGGRTPYSHFRAGTCAPSIACGAADVQKKVGMEEVGSVVRVLQVLARPQPLLPPAGREVDLVQVPLVPDEVEFAGRVHADRDDLLRGGRQQPDLLQLPVLLGQ